MVYKWPIASVCIICVFVSPSQVAAMNKALGYVPITLVALACFVTADKFVFYSYPAVEILQEIVLVGSDDSYIEATEVSFRVAHNNVNEYGQYFNQRDTAQVSDYVAGFDTIGRSLGFHTVEETFPLVSTTDLPVPIYLRDTLKGRASAQRDEHSSGKSVDYQKANARNSPEESVRQAQKENSPSKGRKLFRHGQSIFRSPTVDNDAERQSNPPLAKPTRIESFLKNLPGRSDKHDQTKYDHQ